MPDFYARVKRAGCAESSKPVPPPNSRGSPRGCVAAALVDYKKKTNNRGYGPSDGLSSSRNPSRGSAAGAARDGFRIAREDGRKRPNELNPSYKKAQFLSFNFPNSTIRSVGSTIAEQRIERWRFPRDLSPPPRAAAPRPTRRRASPAMRAIPGRSSPRPLRST
jgi:hypothetical protein